MARKRVVLAGGSGFVGQALAAQFLADGYDVHVLSRDPQAGAPTSGNLLGTVIPWDGMAIGPWAESLEDATAVINLAGKNINCRPTAANLREIVRSRVASVPCLVEAVRRCRRPPMVFIQTTAVGIYGDSGDRLCDESTPLGGAPLKGTVPFSRPFCAWCPRKSGQSPGGFLGETCRQWEKALEDAGGKGDSPIFATKPAWSPMVPAKIGTVPRRVALRLGVVLGRTGGALPPLARLTRCFLGGAAGSGRQYISWLHLSDAVRIYREAVERDDFEGLYIAASPSPVTNAEFMRTLRATLHRPWSPPVPALALRLASWLLDMNTELALSGQRCVPRRLMERGFAFEFSELAPALRDLAGNTRRG